MTVGNKATNVHIAFRIQYSFWFYNIIPVREYQHTLFRRLQPRFPQFDRPSAAQELNRLRQVCRIARHLACPGL